MSRKDRRRVVMITLTPALLLAVRARAAGRRGLGDTMRLMLAGLPERLPAAGPDLPAGPPVRRLALQLPRAERLRLALLVAQTGLPADEVLRRCLLAAVAKTGQPPDTRGIVVATHDDGDCDATHSGSGGRPGPADRPGTGR
jgi:hypothetical protein